ncbi:MAG: cytochrome c oxidase subunit II [Nocardioidaceae bacterium]|nr:cytochrome c oxidase subunit II [Nocardioidaceae bacterium]
MGWWHPERTRERRLKSRAIRLAGFVVIALALTGCSTDSKLERIGFREIKTEQGTEILHLWQGAWIALLATGVVMWGLIIGLPIYFRRRSDDEIPVQTRYNLPIEIFYTIFPIIMVVAFFSQTVRVQDEIMKLDPNPDVVVKVVGQKWTWTFNYPDSVQTDEGTNVFVSGDGDTFPQLVIPVDQTVQFDLYSPDVIHSFGVPAFAMRMDVVPGNNNKFQIKATETGTFDGKCYELCGAYHSRMLFTLKVVTQAHYAAYLNKLAADPDHVTKEPVKGGVYSENLITEDGGVHQ